MYLIKGTFKYVLLKEIVICSVVLLLILSINTVTIEAKMISYQNHTSLNSFSYNFNENSKNKIDSIMNSKSYIKTIDENLVNNYDFVIIANTTFYEYDGDWDLQRLADWHNNYDIINTYIVNLSTIYLNCSFWVNGTWGDGNPDNPYKRSDEGHVTVNYSLFNDSQAMIRNYIRYANYELGVKYALLVGDVYDYHFPIRHLYARGTGAPAGVDLRYTIVPSDMYYGCLNGTFNADHIPNYIGDGDAYNSGTPGYGWGENATESQAGIDEVDWTYEVAIGRFSVDDTTELSNAVRKTIDYLELTGDEDYLLDISLSGGFGGWGGQAEWCANYSRTLNGTTYNDWQSGDTTYGFNPDVYNIQVFDDNPSRPDGINMNDANIQSQINNGCHIWIQSGHGSSAGWNAGGEGEGFGISDIQALTNTNPLIMLCVMPCSSCRFDHSCVTMDQDDTFIEEWQRDYYGACAVLGNTREGWGSYDGDEGIYNGLNSSSHYVGSQIIDAYFNEGLTRLGDMVFDAKQDAQPWHDTYGDGAIRWVVFEQILLGDPTLVLHLKSSKTDNPKIYNVSPNNGSINQNINPILSIEVCDPQGDSMNIIFKTNTSGKWKNIGLPILFANNGSYFKKPLNMNNYKTTYWWSVHIQEIKSGNWTNHTYYFTTLLENYFNPFLKGWNYYKPIIINHTQVKDNLYNFSVLISIKDDDLHKHAQSDGDDILFMLDKGKSTRIYHEIERYDESTGTLIAWVKVGYLSPYQDTRIYMYFGNKNCESQQFTEMTWHKEYVSVWHFNQVSGNIKDSTFNRLNGVPQNNPIPNINSIIGKGVDFGTYGDEKRYHINDSYILDSSNITVSCWIYITKPNFYETMISRENGWQFATDDVQSINTLSRWSEEDKKEIKGGIIKNNLWTFVVSTIEKNEDKTTLKFYIDGEPDIADTTTITRVDTGGDLYIGDWVGIGPDTQDWCGKLDELRIINAAKSPEWIRTEYNNQQNPDNFIQLGKIISRSKLPKVYNNFILSKLLSN